MSKRRLAASVVLAVLLALPAASAADALILATTTSTQDSGLLDVLLPAFEARFHVKVKTIAVGSGEAIAMGRRGDADVLLVHSKAAEDAFLADGYGSLRLDVMHNDFLVVGPPADPAGAKGLDAGEAFRKIAAAGATFVSRGDQSGTHVKEQALWKGAGIDPKGKSWYLSTGQGMGETARIASEKRGYTLMDRGTFLAMRNKLELAPAAEGGKDLLNSYRVIVVNPKKHPKVHAADARKFAEWLVSPEVQKMIGEFGREKFGQSLFVPDAK
jgi:tungstate transport system substrate-binding protein